jgi:hypothetical protein
MRNNTERLESVEIFDGDTLSHGNNWDMALVLMPEFPDKKGMLNDAYSKWTSPGHEAIVWCYPKCDLGWPTSVQNTEFDTLEHLHTALLGRLREYTSSAEACRDNRIPISALTTEGILVALTLLMRKVHPDIHEVIGVPYREKVWMITETFKDGDTMREVPMNGAFWSREAAEREMQKLKDASSNAGVLTVVGYTVWKPETS